MLYLNYKFYPPQNILVVVDVESSFLKPTCPLPLTLPHTSAERINGRRKHIFEKHLKVLFQLWLDSEGHFSKKKEGLTGKESRVRSQKYIMLLVLQHS